MFLLISRDDHFLIMMCLCYHGLPLPMLALSNITWIYCRLGGATNCVQLPAKWTGHKTEAAKSGTKLRCKFKLFLQNLNYLANVHFSSSSSETNLKSILQMLLRKNSIPDTSPDLSTWFES